MRRDESKVKDYALRHRVPRWYTDAHRLIGDPDINAVYVATPPSSHEVYTIAALEAGKPVYVEKPMSVNAASANRMAVIARERNVKLSVAHYRRAQPLFKKIKELLDTGAIDVPRHARLEFNKRSLTREELAVPKTAWRIDPAIAGGGLFHDLAPHQLDLLYYFFGEVERASGTATNQEGIHAVPDNINGTILFKSGLQFDGSWSFNSNSEKDQCEITGEKGRMLFSFFDLQPVVLETDEKKQIFEFDPLQHVQQPMIQKVVDYFLGHSSNPCSGDEGVKVMELLDTISHSY
jgi:predicted dehydrogenase